MEKKNTGLIVLVVILSLLVIGMGSFFVYDKVLNQDEKNISDKDTLLKNNDIRLTVEENQNLTSVFDKVANYVRPFEPYGYNSTTGEYDGERPKMGYNKNVLSNDDNKFQYLVNLIALDIYPIFGNTLNTIWHTESIIGGSGTGYFIDSNLFYSQAIKTFGTSINSEKLEREVWIYSEEKPEYILIYGGGDLGNNPERIQTKKLAFNPQTDIYSLEYAYTYMSGLYAFIHADEQPKVKVEFKLLNNATLQDLKITDIQLISCMAIES